MNPNHFTVEIIDPNQHADWDVFVRAQPQGWVCHTSNWLKVGQHIWKNLKPFYIIVRDKKKGAICSGLPVCLVTSLSGKKRLISTPLSTLIDPISSDTASLEYLLDRLPSLLNENNISSLNIKTFRNTRFIPGKLFSQNDNHIHHEIDLRLNEEDLMKSFNRSNVRNRIRKSLKSPLTLSYAVTVDELKQFYDLYVTTRRGLGLPAIPWSFFEGIWMYMRDQNWVELLLTHHKEEMVGGLLCLKFKGRISAEVLAYRKEFTPMCPNHLLFWSTIIKAKEEGRVEFDFGRTPVSNKTLTTFKNRWGTQKTALSTFNYPKVKNANAQSSSPIINVIKSITRQAPLPLYRQISQVFYSRPR